MMDLEKLKRMLENEEENDEYIGNIWGWKFSLMGLAFILFMCSVLAYGHYSGKVNIYTGKAFETQTDTTSTKIDSIK